MAVIREYHPPRAKQPRVIGAFPMPDGSRRPFKGHTVAEVTQKWKLACDAMEVMLQRKAARRLQMADYSRRRREALKAHGVCQDCGREDAEPGRTLCWSCRLFHNQVRSGARPAPPSPYRDGRRAS
ncbi:MAG: hypothetical protein HDR50_06670 [Desulfovibrio sp.]|uniref:hypothetical protein n=1 Tax=Desulfovibrio sp. TaxID=885 RepID=UPI001A6ADA2C|nr:hypothetical protein [Desulfovibrio sp.]MBD5417331.1 hypothetical protein [Desulfovibrio sp.]